MTRVSELDYQDPTLHQLMVCHPVRECADVPGDMPTTVTLPDCRDSCRWLGRCRGRIGAQDIDDVDVVGSREVTTLNVGTMGNEKAQAGCEGVLVFASFGNQCYYEAIRSASVGGAELRCDEYQPGRTECATVSDSFRDFRMIEMQEQVQLLTQQWPGDLRATRQCRACLW